MFCNVYVQVVHHTFAAMDRRQKRRSSVESDIAADLECEREMRRVLQKKLDSWKNRYKTTVGEFRTVVRNLQESLEHSTTRADEAQLRAINAARMAEEANERAVRSARKAEQAERRAQGMMSVASLTSVSSSDDRPNCPICYDKIFDDGAWVLSCAHVLHAGCRQQLIRHHIERCPVCRAASL